MPQPNEEFFEVDLSGTKDEPRKKDLENLIEVDFSEKNLSFEENMRLCESNLTQIMDEYKVFAFMERRNLLSDSVEVTGGDFLKARKDLEKKYVALVCKSGDEEYEWWVNHTLETLMGALKPEINVEEGVDPDHVAFRIELFQKARTRRKGFKNKH